MSMMKGLFSLKWSSRWF